ncbi:UNVERIFIED_CONTAM: hypothetical protein Sradi_0730100 [Sesamum radiatum]|uniref:Retroviral polymerase SH3-like domain-containing protein n=1 Tax=Sesamum radiatum TaxID=300843 RepID=A0AAW2VRT3_SESRA
MVNFMLSYSGWSDGFWCEAMLMACFLLNKVPNKRNKVTPYEVWYKKKFNLNYLRIWGCRVVVRLPESKKKSLGERGIDCIFIGYAEHSKAYRFYVIAPNDFISVNTVIESMNTIFDETRFSSIPRPKKMIPTMKSQDDAFWKEAINDEMDSIMGNKTWVLVDLPPGYEEVYMKQPEGFIMPSNEHKQQVDLTKEFLSSRFSMKDIGEADVTLGIMIIIENKGISISQSPIH